MQRMRPPESSVSWLPGIVAVLGSPETDPDLDRWTWQDGDVGVFVDKLTHAWQTVAWTPARSVTLRGQYRPSDADMKAIVDLAGLNTPPNTRAAWMHPAPWRTV